MYTAPDASTMGVISILALVANIAVAWMLYVLTPDQCNPLAIWQLICDVALW
jgi:hypothetical protein